MFVVCLLAGSGFIPGLLAEKSCITYLDLSNNKLRGKWGLESRVEESIRWDSGAGEVPCLVEALSCKGMEGEDLSPGDTIALWRSLRPRSSYCRMGISCVAVC